ncbi:MAG: septum site-determining protein Ssd [Nocardioides sp.]
MSAPLVVTADKFLLDELLRLAAAAGVTPAVCRSATEALAAWAAAPLVLVGADLAREVALVRPGRRDAAHLVAIGPVPHELFATALAVGAESVAELPQSEAWLVEALTDAGDRAPSLGRVVGVVGGSGGAGATTFACALGQVGARSGPAILVDLDPLGPGLDRVLGLEQHDGVRWDALQQTTGRLSARSLHDAVPRRSGLGVLTWPSGPPGTTQAFAVREAMSAARRGHDLVVADLPRAADPLVAEVIARCDLLLVLTVPTVTGVAAAARLAGRLRGATPTRLVLRGHGVTVREIERATLLRTAVAMPDQRGLAEAIDLGLGPVRSRRGPLARAAEEVLGSLAAVGRAAWAPTPCRAAWSTQSACG